MHYFRGSLRRAPPYHAPYRDPSSGKVTGLEGRLALDDTNYKNTPKLTWLAEAVAPKGEHTPTTLLHLDVLIKKPVLKPGDDWKEYINYDSKAGQAGCTREVAVATCVPCGVMGSVGCVLCGVMGSVSCVLRGVMVRVSCVLCGVMGRVKCVLWGVLGRVKCVL